MSVRVMTAVWSLPLPDSEKIVLLALADCANDEGLCWPSMKTLAEKCSKSDRTIQAAIKRLANAGHLKREEIRGKGCNYVVQPGGTPTPEAASPPKRLRPTPETIAPPPPKRLRTNLKENHQEPSLEIDGLEAPKHGPDDLIRSWNEMAERCDLPKARMTEARRRTAAARIRQFTMQDFTEAIAAVERSQFLRGENDRGWRANFDFFLQPSSFTKLIEGSYDRGQGTWNRNHDHQGVWGRAHDTVSRIIGTG